MKRNFFINSIEISNDCVVFVHLSKFMVVVVVVVLSFFSLILFPVFSVNLAWVLMDFFRAREQIVTVSVTVAGSSNNNTSTYAVYQ